MVIRMLFFFLFFIFSLTGCNKEGGMLSEKINFIQDLGLCISCEIHTCVMHLDANFKIFCTFAEVVKHVFAFLGLY